ncbi:MAG: hypothetical protein Q9214_001389 [Letrouitia sp. 1 TL-2023]
MDDPDQLPFPSRNVLMKTNIQGAIYTSLFDCSKRKFSPPDRYKYRVLKKLLRLLEDSVEDPEEDEISDDLCDCFAELVRKPLASEIDASRRKCYVTYTFPNTSSNASTVTMLESPSLMASSGTTGLRTWDAALYLATCLSSPSGREFVKDKSILELGAGLGFLSIFCVQHLGAKSALITDGNGELVKDSKENIRINGLGDSGKINSAVLTWGDKLGSNTDGGNGGSFCYDLVLGADMVYDPTSFRPLFSTLKQLFNENIKLKVLISTAVRRESTLEVFLSACEAHNFSVTHLEAPMIPENEQLGFFHSSFAPIYIYLITYSGKSA